MLRGTAHTTVFHKDHDDLEQNRHPVDFKFSMFVTGRLLPRDSCLLVYSVLFTSSMNFGLCKKP